MLQQTDSAWNSPSRVLELRTLLFGPVHALATSASKRRALDLIHAYGLRRESMPKAIECTALLVNALLCDEDDFDASLEDGDSDEDLSAKRAQSQTSSSTSSDEHDKTEKKSSSITSQNIRKRKRSDIFPPRALKRRRLPFTHNLALSAAFTHFVTRFCDSPSASIPHKISMLDAARRVGIPERFVGWRHEIAHREWVSAGRLKGMCEAGVEWLRVHYWDDVKCGDASDMDTGEWHLDEDLKKVLEDVVVEFRRRRLGELKGGRRGEKNESLISDAVKEAVVRLLQRTSGRFWALPAAYLAQALVREKSLIPHDHRIGANMEGAFTLWDQFLRVLSRLQPDLLTMFLDRLVDGLDEDNGAGYAEACKKWILHILEDAEWIAFLIQLEAHTSNVGTNTREWVVQKLMQRGLMGRRVSVWEKLWTEDDRRIGMKDSG